MKQTKRFQTGGWSIEIRVMRTWQMARGTWHKWLNISSGFYVCHAWCGSDHVSSRVLASRGVYLWASREACVRSAVTLVTKCYFLHVTGTLQDDVM